VKFKDFKSLFEESKTEIAILSTYNFDPVFFETYLLRSKALSSARRIFVFMDAGQYFGIFDSNKIPPRYINRRYLVIPISKPNGVFHPKFHLLLGREQARLICGSNNLTQPGCTHNLELLNCISVFFDKSEKMSEEGALVLDGLDFFRKALDFSAGFEPRLFREWSENAEMEFPWLRASQSLLAAKKNPKLIHSLSGRIWDQVARELRDHSPTRVLVISPFFDADLALMKRIKNTWPKCRIEIIAQQMTSNIKPQLLVGQQDHVNLYDLQLDGRRRLHAKLIAFETAKGCFCLAGSTNFTLAALDGDNIEVCLWLELSARFEEDLFGDDIRKIKIRPELFKPGTIEAPSYNEFPGAIQLNSVLLDSEGTLTVSYEYRMEPRPGQMKIRFFKIYETRPSFTLEIQYAKKGEVSFHLDESKLSSFDTASYCSLVATSGSQEFISNPCWVIQERHLTRDSEGTDSRSEVKKRIEETGSGLAEYIGYLIHHEGYREAIEYLRGLNIRYNETTWAPRSTSFKPPKLRDPFRPDERGSWLDAPIDLGKDADVLAQAIYEFIDRHQKRVLLRHAKRGNLNGMSNFLDVFVCTNKLIYVYLRKMARSQEGLKPIVNKNFAIFYLRKNLQIFTVGENDGKKSFPGYIKKLRENLASDLVILRNAIEEGNILGHIQASFLVAQWIRHDPKLKKFSRPRDCLPHVAEYVRECLELLNMRRAAPDEVFDSLHSYKVFTEQEIRTILE
jgi:hypothetical protein